MLSVARACGLLAVVFLLAACGPPEQRAYLEAGGYQFGHGDPNQGGTAWEKVADRRFKVVAAGPRRKVAAQPLEELPKLWPAALGVAAKVSLDSGAESFAIESFQVLRMEMRNSYGSGGLSILLSMIIVPGPSAAGGPSYSAREIVAGKAYPLPHAAQPDPGRRMVQDLMR
jgi:hypothetical protein